METKDIILYEYFTNDILRNREDCVKGYFTVNRALIDYLKGWAVKVANDESIRKFKHYVIGANHPQGAPIVLTYNMDFTFARVFTEDIHQNLEGATQVYLGGFDDVMIASQFAEKIVNDLEKDKLNSFLK